MSFFSSVRIRILAHLYNRSVCNRLSVRQLALACGTLFAAAGPALAQTDLAPPGGVVHVSARAGSAMRAGKGGAILLKLEIAPGFHINTNPASDEYLIPVTAKLAAEPGIVAGKPLYPHGESKTFSFSPTPISVFQGQVFIPIPLSIATGARPGAHELRGTVHYQACSDRACQIPTDAHFPVEVTVVNSGSAVPAPLSARAGGASGQASATVVGASETLRNRFAVRGLPTLVFIDSAGHERPDLRTGEELTRETMIAKLSALKSGRRMEQDSNGSGGWSRRLSRAPFWLQLVLCFFGGLLLNLTPCVYPMIPITIGYFGSQSEGRVGKTFGLAALYVLGLSLVYSTLGIFAARTGALFGSTLQSPYVVGFVALVLLLLGLSMAGLFTLQPPQFFMSRSGARKGGLGALAMGMLLGIVAAPCVGPVVAALLTYVGTTGDMRFGFALFFTLSLGLGLPYLVLGALGGAIKSLPRSGAWLEKSKKFFSIPLLLAALFYGYTALSVGLKSAKNQVPEIAASDATGRWPAASPALLAEARAAHIPVVLDFRADWCLPCRKLEREVFVQSDVRAAAAGVKLMQIDLTSASS